MKTTLDIDDALLIKAKTLAAQRRTTLKALVEHALSREILPPPELTPEQSQYMEIGPLGIIRIKKTGPPMTAEAYQAMVDRVEQEEDERYLPPPAK
jgi:hypothetical protein